MESKKSLSRAKAEFVEAILEAVSGLPREAADQKLSAVVCDVYNEAERAVRKIPTRPKPKEV